MKNTISDKKNMEKNLPRIKFRRVIELVNNSLTVPNATSLEIDIKEITNIIKTMNCKAAFREKTLT